MEDLDELLDSILACKPTRTYDPEYYARNKGRFKEYNRKYLSNPTNKAKLKVYSKKWKKENPERNKLHGRRTNIKKKFNISLDQWDKLFEFQNRQCGICKTKNPGKKGWQTDHCHSTNIVRGILCGPCNMALGGFKDNPELLEVAAAYIRRHY